MDPNFKAQWVEALRSGQYDQARGCLRSQIGHCCLGVACDLSGLGTWAVSEFEEDEFVFLSTSDEVDSQCSTSLPEHLKAEMGLSDDQELTLMNLNDGNLTSGVKKHSFAEIAAYIEANL